MIYSWAQSYPGKWINFISTDTLVYGGEGNVINVVRISGEHCHSKTSLGVGIGPVICCAASSIIAYSESTLKPKIFLVKFPSFEVISTLEGLAYVAPFYILFYKELFVQWYRWSSDGLQLFGIFSRWKLHSKFIIITRLSLDSLVSKQNMREYKSISLHCQVVCYWCGDS